MLDSIAPDWVAVVRASIGIALRRRDANDLPDELAATIAAKLHELASATGFRKAFGLSERETLVAWVAICAQLDPETAMQLEGLGSVDPTCGSLTAIAFSNDLREAMAALGDDAPLLRHGLIERVVEPHASTPTWIRQKIRASQFLLTAALDGQTDSLLRGLRARPHSLPDIVAVSSGVAEDIARAIDRRCVLLVVGPSGSGRRSAIERAARDADKNLTAIDARRLSKELVTFRQELVAISRDCRYLDAAALLCNIDTLASEPTDQRLEIVGEWCGGLEHGLYATANRLLPIRSDKSTISVELRALTFSQRTDLWHRALGQGTTGDAELLAAAYPLAPATIVKAGAAARTRAGHKPLQSDDVLAGIRVVLDDALGAFAKRVQVTQTWDDIVLPQDHIDMVAELVARVRERHKVFEQWGFGAKVAKGLGVTALFSGPPGTGKTMIASLIANELGLELYQVDMSKVVSKYIGETEKNLAAVFDAAEACQAVVLFDEADALFGKRTDVKSSNDRYANFETNFLLQRLESFTGICLLTTNHESSMDAAFQRRLSFHLRFTLPDVAERSALWQAMLPAAAPVSARLDLDRLAREFSMSGGYIRNATLRAAFLAAGEGCPIEHRHLHHAARLEYEALGKL